MAGKIYHPERKHPEPYQQDLGPNASKGLNYGQEGAPAPMRTAYDVKVVHNRLRDFTDDELKQMGVLQAGSRLETKATYFRLSDETVYRAQGDEDIADDDFFLPKKEMPYQLWNRLVPQDEPE